MTLGTLEISLCPLKTPFKKGEQKKRGKGSKKGRKKVKKLKKLFFGESNPGHLRFILKMTSRYPDH